MVVTMNASHRIFALGAGLLAAALLAGCATGVSKDQCAAADWRTVGYEDGLRGAPADRIGAHRAGCGKHGVTPDLAAYLDGRERGLVEYCQPKNGFRVGVNGGGYANVCPARTETAFVDGYRHGRQIYEARSELRKTQSQLRSAKQNLAQTDTAMADVTAELVLPNVPRERRGFLAAELVRLTQARTGLAERIEQLSALSQEQAANVRLLEQQSPYVL